ncbi:protein arginine N-methyltransferase 1 [Anthonomus grandis grandis]|uniref:protein arginine N-methyltransferase 1 n=1 Tax=Anthonomus grandis grandis TaxID=2921223 RepID=UPI0021653B64|nr:protein arginine N-methyltransferase 1 [Anthonomus grandis grandis]
MAEALQDVSPTCPKSEDEDSDGWDEMELGGEQTTCLFCNLQFHTIAVALDHCRTAHNFDLLALKNKHNMDCYSYIKMINYIRLQKPEPKMIQEASVALWDDDCYLKPGEMEPWLMYDFDDLGSAPSTPHYAIDGKTPISNLNFGELQRHIHDLNLQLKQRDMLIESFQKDMEKMKQVTRTLVVDSGGDSITKMSPSDSSLGDSDGYFGSYSHFGIHHEMLNDKVRTESYRDAILNNSDSFKDKFVLDVGCGTGILSMFCAKAGARTVIGVDQSEVVYKAMDIVRENSLQDTIQLIKGQLEKTSLPVEKVDIIVSEWMGYFLLFEGMLDSVIYARDKYLNEGGLLLPNRCTISLVGVCDEDRYKNLIDFWDNVYGFSMKCMKPEILLEANVETVPNDKLITDSVVVSEIDIMTCTTNACNFKKDFTFTARKEGKLTAIAGYFDTFFDLTQKVEFSTGPQVDRTHWQQTVFYLGKTVELQEGQTLNCSISCSRLKKNARGLSVTLTVDKSKYDYIVD